MKLEFDRAVNDIIDNSMIEKLKQFTDIIVFGAGESGSWVNDWLKNHGIFPKCFCDNYKEKWGEIKDGLVVEPLTSALVKYPQAAICVASMWCDDILKDIGDLDKKLLSRTWDMLYSMAWETSDKIYQSQEAEFIHGNSVGFDTLYDQLKDPYSKETLKGLLNYRITRDKSYLRSIKSNEEVYLDKTVIPPVLFSKISQGIIIDGGAFDGDSVNLFIDRLGQEQNLDIHCFEAEKRNCEKMKEKLAIWSPHQIHIHESALWGEQKARVSFGGHGLSGKLDASKAGQEENNTDTVRLDDYEYENVRLIKLDIEGAERQALKGAQAVIKKSRPILAICAYHLQDDLLCLPDIIQSMKCGYKFYLRHYMNSSGDTILYAIPDDYM